MNPKILIICSSLNVPGGLERMIVSLANELSVDGFRVTIFISEKIKNSFYPINFKVRVINEQLNFGITTKGNLLTRKVRFFRDVFTLRNVLMIEEADFVINTEYSYTVASILCKLPKKTKIITWEHGDFFSRKSSFWKLLIKQTYRKVDAIVCLNPDEKKLFDRFQSKIVEVIPNFIKVVDYVQGPKEQVILTVARMVPAKGLHILMDAAKIILNRHKDWQWKVIGSGILEAEFKSFIQNNHLQNQLLLVPAQSPNLDKEYAEASIYVLTSLHERLPMVLIEAMSHKLPCIAFDCETGPRHIITNNVDGILVEKENSEKLIEAISLLIKDKEKRSKWGFAAHENMQRFSDLIVIPKWKYLFRKLQE